MSSNRAVVNFITYYFGFVQVENLDYQIVLSEKQS